MKNKNKDNDKDNDEDKDKYKDKDEYTDTYKDTDNDNDKDEYNDNDNGKCLLGLLDDLLHGLEGVTSLQLLALDLLHALLGGLGRHLWGLRARHVLEHLHEVDLADLLQGTLEGPHGLLDLLWGLEILLRLHVHQLFVHLNS